MPHLNLEELARLVDEPPSPAETDHLGACAGCTEALAELRRQTAALAALPAIDAPEDGWARLEARLRAESLIRRPTPLASGRRGSWAAAAAVAAFLLGGAAGFSLRGADDAPAGGELPRVTTRQPAGLAVPVTLDEAEGQVRVAESQYLAALSRYNALRGPSSGATGGDPWAARLAALESIVASTRAALAEAPYDPVINGYYINARAQRDAMFRQVSTEDGDQWY